MNKQKNYPFYICGTDNLRQKVQAKKLVKSISEVVFWIFSNFWFRKYGLVWVGKYKDLLRFYITVI